MKALITAHRFTKKLINVWWGISNCISVLGGGRLEMTTAHDLPTSGAHSEGFGSILAKNNWIGPWYCSFILIPSLGFYSGIGFRFNPNLDLSGYRSNYNRILIEFWFNSDQIIILLTQVPVKFLWNSDRSLIEFWLNSDCIVVGLGWNFDWIIVVSWLSSDSVVMVMSFRCVGILKLIPTGSHPKHT